MADSGFARARRILLLSIVVLAAVFALQLAFSYLVLPRMRLGQILLESSLDLPDAEVLALGGLSGRENYLSLDEQAVARRFESSPFIRRAYVEKQFPNTLKVVLYPRRAIGITGDAGHSLASYFDEYGVVYAGSGPFQHKDLPVLSGVKPEDGRFPEGLSGFLKDLSRLQSEAPLLYDQISEMVLIPSGESLYDLKMYLNAYKLPVLLQAELSEGLMKKILLVLDSLKTGQREEEWEYADFRTDQVVLKTREGV